jgi:hypothetical protein
MKSLLCPEQFPSSCFMAGQVCSLILILSASSLAWLYPLGAFDEFSPVIKPLTQQAQTSTGRNVSFDVIVPSLPGFTFSSAPPANWTVDDTARVFNTLMVNVLGYEEYTTHGTDWVNFFLQFLTVYKLRPSAFRDLMLATRCIIISIRLSEHPILLSSHSLLSRRIRSLI